MSADQQLPELISGLLRPGAYDHPAGEISLIETHISWVILTGPFAYKLKKPVQFAFVDYSTARRREHFCHEEVRLNRRFAPGLYLDVVPVTGSARRPKVGGGGEAIAHAVKMRQFPQESLLSHQIETGQLRAAHIDRLAAEVAGFHARAERARPGSGFGTADAVIGPARDNFASLRATGLPGAHAGQIARLADWTESEFLRLARAFDARLRDGLVRECHGDLHLGNMVLDEDGGVTLFDGIEFNEGFRWIDVMDEVAFCTMDLMDRGRPDLAHRFLNAYLEHSGDYPGLAVVRFYIVYRAIVRAKVAALRLRQEREGGAGVEPELADEIAAYLELAGRAAQPRGTPVLAVTHGLSGSGKTTATQQLVDELGFVRIRSDVERKRLFDLLPEGDSASGVGTGIYTEEATQETYRRAAGLAEAAAGAGFSTVVDAAFLQREQRQMFSDLAARLGLPFRILHLKLPLPELRRRVEERRRHSRDASEATVEVLEHQLAVRQVLDRDELQRTVELQVGTPVSEALRDHLGPARVD